MNSFINFFYNINVNNIIYNDKYYSFIYNGYTYKLYVVDKNINIDFLLYIDKMLVSNSLVSEIIINKNNSVISNYKGDNYVLIKIYCNINKKITLEEISYFDNLLYSNQINSNWGLLWSKKIDYLEELISENGRKYPLLVDSFNYFVGMAENAISYYNDIVINTSKCVISHKKIGFDDSIEVIYNPLNIIFDCQARDIAEYIKNSFWIDNRNIFNELDSFFRKVYLEITDIKLIIARLMYPSFYFNMYEDILVYNQDEKKLINIINRLDDYECFLGSVISYFKKRYDVMDIKWLYK